MIHSEALAEVVAVHSIASMQSQLKQDEYDVVILDFEILDGTGFVALNEIKSRSDSPAVVLIFSEGDEFLASDAIKQVVDHCLIKDDDLSELLDLVNKTLSGHATELIKQEVAAHAQYQSWLLDHVDDGIVVAGLDREIRYWNKAVEHLLGRSRKEVLGKKLLDILRTALTPSSLSSIESSFNQKRANVEIELLPGNSHATWIDTRVNRMEGSEDVQRGYIFVFRNITRQKLVEERRRLLEVGVENARLAVIITEAKRFWLDGSIVYVNPAFTELTGYALEEIIGQTPRLIFGSKMETDILDRYRETSNGHEAYSGVMINYRKDGSEYVVDTHVAPVCNNGGEILNWVFIQHDITKRNNESNKIQTTRLHPRQALRLSALSELTNNLAHQINNPMTTILGEAQLLTRELEGGSAAYEAAKTVEIAGWRATEAMRQLLDLTDPSQADETVLDVNNSILTAVDMISNLIEQDGTVLHLDLAQSLPKIIGKERDLLDAWINLLLGVRESTAGFESPEIQLASYLNDGDIKVTIEFPADTYSLPAGEEDLSSVFDLPMYAVGAEYIHQCGGSLEFDNKAKDLYQLLISLNTTVNIEEFNKI